MPDTQASLSPTDNLAGEYKGVLAMYDWSGQNLIGEKPLTVSVLQADSTLQCRWCEGNDTIMATAYINQEGRLVFSKGIIRKYERYIEGSPVPYRFENADISIECGFMTGRLRLYSMAQQEPERPMYLTLQKMNVTETTEIESENSRIYAYPNPFAQQVTISFDLQDDVKQAKALVYSQSGSCMASYSLGGLAEGHHTVVLSPAVPDGIYVLHVIAGKQTFQTIIVKKRSAL